MKINGNDNKIRFKGENHNCEIKKPENKAVLKEVQANSQDALEAMSRAQINMSKNERDEFLKKVDTLTIDMDLEEQKQLIEKIKNNEKLYKNPNLKNIVNNVIDPVNSEDRQYIALKILDDENLYNNETLIKNADRIIEAVNYFVCGAQDISDIILSDERLYNSEAFLKKVGDILEYSDIDEKSQRVKNLLVDKEILPQQIYHILYDDMDDSYSKYKKLNNTIGFEKVEEFPNDKDMMMAAKFIELYKKEDINEIPITQRKDILDNLVKKNSKLFEISNTLKEIYPLIPTTKEEYCSIIPSIVCSLGIETNPLSKDGIDKFTVNINNLSDSLSNLTDEEFNNLEFKLNYTKDEFIKDIYNIIKDCNPKTRQKALDYFGFNFQINKNANTKIETKNGDIQGISIVGYPINLDNKKYLNNDETKEIIEKIKPYVIKFSEKNKINCKNDKIEKELNNIIKAMPELIPSIDNIQAGMNQTKGSHSFDIFKHSLKVMQKISQDSNFALLNDSDKKVMLLASLFHDITKKEGYIDPAHNKTSSFDAYHITKKLNLTKDEEIKLYTLIKEHEWLKYVNTANNQTEFEKRLQSVAYDLRHDNIFDMSLIFTHADLKAIKTSDTFHNSTTGYIREDFTGKKLSLGKRADVYAKSIKKYIEKLKPSQPLLPVTNFPKASVIKNAITTINDDGSTNIKGVYVDSNGMIVIKYNEVTNSGWEEIGFDKGTVSKGIDASIRTDEKIDTGNIHFMVHGLEFPNQLTNFDIFNMPDSDALLSVSYAERPESKYRFFKPQGILLNVDTKYIHGGIESDSGSGCGKTIDKFKNDYIYEGCTKKDRFYISNLIKRVLGMDDKKYIEFVKENENKSFSEIEPKETRERLIRAFCSINSIMKEGFRRYNEILISNPKPPMAVYAYDMEYKSTVDNPVDFLEKEYNDKRTKFLKEYAMSHDIPFIVFGD